MTTTYPHRRLRVVSEVPKTMELTAVMVNIPVTGSFTNFRGASPLITYASAPIQKRITVHHHLIMPRITVTISDELDEYLEDNSGDDDDFDSKSEVMRHLANRGLEADDLEREIELKQNKIEDLERQMGARDQVEEKVDVLAKRIEEEQSSPNPPFFVEWVQWFRSRGDDDENGDKDVE